MGSKLGPNYSFCVIGHIENQIFNQYKGRVPELINATSATVGATCGAMEEIEDFANLSTVLIPVLNSPWAIYF